MSEAQKNIITGMAPVFNGIIPPFWSYLSRIQEAFRTGRGMHYDEHGLGMAQAIESMNTPWYEANFINLLKTVDDGKLALKLEEGVNVIEIGCGTGKLLLLLAKTFAKSQFLGLDTSQHALNLANKAIEKADIKNIKIIDPKEITLAKNHFSLAISLDCLHDMTHPTKVIGDLRQWMKDDGVWVCSDEKSYQHLSDMKQKHPCPAMLYGFSVNLCMSSALSTPDGEGLGTAGMFPEKLEAISRKAGFKHFRLLQENDGCPLNPSQHTYIIKP